MNKTIEEYDLIRETCYDIFKTKMEDYGTAWKILRLSSLTDQIYIKACRIRSIEEKKVSKINENVVAEYIGMINYSIIALFQLEKQPVIEPCQSEYYQMLSFYIKIFETAKDLMLNKNHDYDEAWRNMRITSLTDLILQKLLRIKQIEDNDGITKISEGLSANYYDIINYSVFALIKLETLKNNQ
jgi:hypothetical protein